jgi:beta-glucanase (GH16 family)
VNPKVLQEKVDMTGEVRILNCPKEFRKEAEKIMMMVTELDYALPYEQSVTELDKYLQADCWKKYDGFKDNMDFIDFKIWYTQKVTTNPEMIRRAREWLRQHNYIYYTPEAEERAIRAASNMRASIKSARND